MTEFTQTIETGPGYAQLGNAVSRAISDAIAAGLDGDAAVCIAAQVAADYAVRARGPAFVEQIAAIMVERAKAPGGRTIPHAKGLV